MKCQHVNYITRRLPRLVQPADARWTASRLTRIVCNTRVTCKGVLRYTQGTPGRTRFAQCRTNLDPLTGLAWSATRDISYIPRFFRPSLRLLWIFWQRIKPEVPLRFNFSGIWNIHHNYNSDDKSIFVNIKDICFPVTTLKTTLYV